MIWRVVRVLVVVCLSTLVVSCSPTKVLGFETFYVPSESNEPTLQVNDVLRADTLKADEKIEDGWFIVFDPPPGYPREDVDRLIKRIVAGPGETVEARDGDLYVNDVLVDEPYLKTPHSTGQLPKVTVGQNQYFVLGDNRENSEDSRYFGLIDRKLITHHATKITKPADHAGELP